MNQEERQNEQAIIEVLDKALNEFIDRVFEKSQTKLAEEGKVDTGNLLKTANIERKPLEKTIVYPADYAEWVEFGRLPGSMPPPGELQKWCERKLKLKPKEAKKAAWAIAKAIEQRGIQPFPFLTRSAMETIQEMGLQ
ncbi:HK97 gp10 family phage protein [Candidatus Woesearchaeota archaeon]|nr:MAG: HK97 gp10 family phage protein [Candidatus Woesearchaeota archaeon]